MNHRDDKKSCSQRPGVALILTVIVLVLLTALVYRLTSAVSQWKHRMQYMIDYQMARYACESGMKYALATINGFEPNCVSRPNEPDFSDLFNMSDEQYKMMMEEWAKQMGTQIDSNNISKTDSNSQTIDFSFLFGSNDVNFSNFSSYFGDINDSNVSETNEIFVRGPYGPTWPYVKEPIEIQFGDATVKIEILDENAKLPLVWGLNADANAKSESQAAIQTFCEWMQMEPNTIDPLISELKQIQEIKPFSLNLKPVVTVTQQNQDTSQQAEATSEAGSASARLRARREALRKRRLSRTRTANVQQTRPETGHTMDFVKILHSPMIDLEKLAVPVNEDENRQESALKYIDLWGAQKVNINSAPRQVLEAAFTFGGDAPQIAEQIISMRREQPFKDVNDLAKKLYSFNDSIDKAKPYITTTSDFFAIRVIATSGVARVCATAGIKKEKDKYQQIGIIIE